MQANVRLLCGGDWRCILARKTRFLGDMTDMLRRTIKYLSRLMHYRSDMAALPKEGGGMKASRTKKKESKPEHDVEYDESDYW
jgi:hypothetical protein